MPEGFEAIEVDEEVSSLARAVAESGDLLPITAIAPEAGPPGAKGLAETLGVIALAVTSSPQALTAAIEAIGSWLVTSSSRSVIVEIDGDRLEVANPTRDETRALVELFVRRHTVD
ncbi:hypothetical protein AWW66_19575 [Micromonospora rosaria]|uniref:Uncharacterized protein n=2 Tax=Micromonospora rosaria TaxID=47874 RepID=A0A136PP74_9ACTN|nr:hypothetical protein AWW66_19575 [Micromonospora rosaria]